MKACFLIAECSLSYAKIQLFSNMTTFPCRKKMHTKEKGTKKFGSYREIAYFCIR